MPARRGRARRWPHRRLRPGSGDERRAAALLHARECEASSPPAVRMAARTCESRSACSADRHFARSQASAVTASCTSTFFEFAARHDDGGRIHVTARRGREASCVPAAPKREHLFTRACPAEFGVIDNRMTRRGCPMTESTRSPRCGWAWRCRDAALDLVAHRDGDVGDRRRHRRPIGHRRRSRRRRARHRPVLDQVPVRTGAVVLTFLAGAELDPASSAQMEGSSAVGLVGFLAPFLGCTAAATGAGLGRVRAGWRASRCRRRRSPSSTR